MAENGAAADDEPAAAHTLHKFDGGPSPARKNRARAQVSGR